MPGHALPGRKTVRNARNSLSERNEESAKIRRFKSLSLALSCQQRRLDGDSKGARKLYALVIALTA